MALDLQSTAIVAVTPLDCKSSGSGAGVFEGLWLSDM